MFGRDTKYLVAMGLLIGLMSLLQELVYCKNGLIVRSNQLLELMSSCVTEVNGHRSIIENFKFKNILY
jgi:hypothetical protein